jgi:hypothetical protein
MAATDSAAGASAGEGGVPVVDLTELVRRLEAAALEASDLSVTLTRAARAEMDRAGLMADLAAVLKGTP